MPVIFQQRIHRLDLHRNRKVLYAFGDNDERRGQGGQAAECRGEPNAVGIRTKLAAGYGAVYYSDVHYEENCAKIDEDFKRLFDHINKRGIVVWPSDGVGTGFARLDTFAPRTLAHIERKLKQLVLLDDASEGVDSWGS